MSTQIGKEGWIIKKLGEVLSYEQPTKYLVRSSAYQTHFMTPVLTAGKTFLLGYTDESFGVYNKLPVIIFDDFTTASKFVDFPFKAKSSAMKMLKPRSEDFNPKLLFEILNSLKFEVSDHKRHWISEFVNIEICIPGSRVEQAAIAEVLSDVDELIAQTERLIAKKKAIKLGLMQELLRPKEGWISRKLKELVSTPITDGPHETPNFVEEGVPFLSVNNIANNRLSWNGVRFISKEDDTIFSKKCKPCKGDILFGKAASVGKVALVDTDDDFNIWSPLALIRPNSEISNRFLYYYLQSGQVSRQIDFFTNSSSQGNIGMGDIERIEINLPGTQLVQQAIVEVLSEVDEELNLMHDMCFKYEQLKSAMTNQLLTGKTRLV